MLTIFRITRANHASRSINSILAKKRSCMYHLILSVQLDSITSRTAYASFGGLLMSLTGSFRHMTSIVLGDPVYLLIRR